MSFELNLKTETVKHAYPTEPLSVSPGESIRAVMLLMKERREACVLVMDDGKPGGGKPSGGNPDGGNPDGGNPDGGELAGIFTERDALSIMARGDDLDRPVSEVMVTRPETISLTQLVGDAITKMSVGGYRRLPIIDGGAPVGVLSVPGILRYLVDHFPTVIYTLPPDPHHATQEREGA